MSADGLQLIGVAGIDVQLAGLDSDPVLKAGVESVLTTSPHRLITLNPQAANISICNSVSPTSPSFEKIRFLESSWLDRTCFPRLSSCSV